MSAIKKEKIIVDVTRGDCLEANGTIKRTNTDS